MTFERLVNSLKSEKNIRFNFILVGNLAPSILPQESLGFNFIFLDFSGIMLPSISHKNHESFNRDLTRKSKI
jgi:hypothetical protein